MRSRDIHNKPSIPICEQLYAPKFLSLLRYMKRFEFKLKGVEKWFPSHSVILMGLHINLTNTYVISVPD